jgi:hypothetical protein
MSSAVLSEEASPTEGIASNQYQHFYHKGIRYNQYQVCNCDQAAQRDITMTQGRNNYQCAKVNLKAV